jgi:outer membrane protein assembly factor BamB
MKRFAIKLSSLSFICLLSLLAAQTSSSDAANSSNWPQWRGPDAQGVSNDKNLPTEWNEKKNVLWKAAIPGKGFSQPIIWGKKVFLTTDIEGGPESTGYKPPKRIIGDKEFTHPDWDGKDSFMTALDKNTGKEVWRVKRPVQVSWSTPVVVKTPQRAELIVSGNEFLISYDPNTGKEFWRAGGLKSHAIATPVAGHGLVILSSGFPSKVITAIKLGGSGALDGTDKIAWRYNKGTSYVPSPILYGDYVYLMSDGGILTCLNAKTGEVVYEGGRVPVATKFYGASPVAFDGKILLTSDDGDTFVIKAGPQHEVLGTNSIGEPCRTSIAIAEGKLFIRGEKHLFCISNKG